MSPAGVSSIRMRDMYINTGAGRNHSTGSFIRQVAPPPCRSTSIAHPLVIPLPRRWRWRRHASFVRGWVRSSRPNPFYRFSTPVPYVSSTLRKALILLRSRLALHIIISSRLLNSVVWYNGHTCFRQTCFIIFVVKWFVH